MKMGQIVAAIVVVVVVLVGGYFLLYHNSNGSNYSNTTNTSTTSTNASSSTDTSQSTSTAPADSNASGDSSAAGDMNLGTLSIGHSVTIGDYLVASNGMTLYAYGKDTPNKSNCTGACATNWPAYTVTNATSITAIDGVNGKLGTIPGPNGQFQVTYNGSPLYFFISDKQAGDTTGNDLNSFAVVQP